VSALRSLLATGACVYIVIAALFLLFECAAGLGIGLAPAYGLASVELAIGMFCDPL
jgi:hypothetical protein